MQVSELIKNLLAINKPSFVCVVGYTADKTGEVANHRLNIGRKYETAVKVTVQRLTDYILTIEDSESIAFKAAQALLNSAVNNQSPETASVQSMAQSNTYTALGRNVGEHTVTGEIYINCFSVGKTLIQKGVYKEVKSGPLVVEKNRITKLLKLPTAQYRRFKISKVNGIKMKGKDLLITVDEYENNSVENKDAEYFD